MSTYARIGKAGGVKAPLYLMDGDSCWRWPFEKRRDGAEVKFTGLVWVTEDSGGLKPEKFVKIKATAEMSAEFKRAMTKDGANAIRVASRTAKNTPKAQVVTPALVVVDEEYLPEFSAADALSA